MPKQRGTGMPNSPGSDKIEAAIKERGFTVAMAQYAPGRGWRITYGMANTSSNMWTGIKTVDAVMAKIERGEL